MPNFCEAPMTFSLHSLLTLLGVVARGIRSRRLSGWLGCGPHRSAWRPIRDVRARVGSISPRIDAVAKLSSERPQVAQGPIFARFLTTARRLGPPLGA